MHPISHQSIQQAGSKEQRSSSVTSSEGGLPPTASILGPAAVSTGAHRLSGPLDPRGLPLREGFEKKSLAFTGTVSV